MILARRLSGMRSDPDSFTPSHASTLSLIKAEFTHRVLGRSASAYWVCNRDAKSLVSPFGANGLLKTVMNKRLAA
jgi:hypothetical protein